MLHLNRDAILAIRECDNFKTVSINSAELALLSRFFG